MRIQIKNYQSNYYKALADIFYLSVHRVDPQIYNQAQQHAWAKQPIDYNFWKKRFEKTQPYCAFIKQQCVGFIELEENGHIDCTYIHPDYQRQGVATQLYQHIETIAVRNHCGSTKHNQTLCRSILDSKPLFKKLGFKTLNRNQIKRNEEVLINFSMEKEIGK